MHASSHARRLRTHAAGLHATPFAKPEYNTLEDVCNVVFLTVVILGLFVIGEAESRRFGGIYDIPDLGSNLTTATCEHRAIPSPPIHEHIRVRFPSGSRSPASTHGQSGSQSPASKHGQSGSRSPASTHGQSAPWFCCVQMWRSSSHLLPSAGTS